MPRWMIFYDTACQLASAQAASADPLPYLKSVFFAAQAWLPGSGNLRQCLPDLTGVIRSHQAGDFLAIF